MTACVCSKYMEVANCVCGEMKPDVYDPAKGADEWKRCRHWIEAALPVTHRMEDIEKGITEGTYQFWPGQRSALITVIENYPHTRNLHVFLAGGDLDEIRAMQPDLLSWADFHGCDAVTLSGRKGWERALKSQGWAHVATTLALPVPVKTT